MEDEKLIELLDERFARVDQQFARVDQQFASVDEQFAKLHEEIRDSAMRTERVEEELGSTRMHIRALDARIERLSNEVTLPSGRISQQFMNAEERDRQTRVLVEQLNGKIIANGEQMDLIQQKLDAFRVETNSRLDALEGSRR